jgi:hypothetical protein
MDSQTHKLIQSELDELEIRIGRSCVPVKQTVDIYRRTRRFLLAELSIGVSDVLFESR